MSKTAALLKHLQKGKTISPKQAWKKWGLYRLADSCFKLRRRGYRISTVLVRKGRDIYATYKLNKK